MKKSELRNIIKESIKELITEQSAIPAGQYSPNAGLQHLQFTICEDEAVAAGPQYSWIFNQYNTGSCCGNTYAITFNGYHHGLGPGASGDITTAYGGHFWPLVQAIQAGNPINGWYDNFTDCTSNCSGPNCSSGSSSGCDPSAWSNHSNWISTWTNNNAFQNVNNNPNQPCTHICNQIQNWTNNLSSAGSVQTNQLNCKIDEGNNQAQIHNCNC